MAVKPKIYVFADNSCQALPEYTAADVAAVLQHAGLAWETVDVAGLATLSRRRGGILVFPYVDGDLPDRALAGLTRFHAAGGSLLVLGDLPHRGRWYPMRNSHAYRLHLSRAYDDVSISADRPGIKGVTAMGRNILGSLPHPGFFSGRSFPSLRITAFPPDISYPLLRVHSSSHTRQSSGIVVVERRRRGFLGAKFAMIGYNGGEPRENTLGIYQRPWRYDPGLLTREWRGIGHVVLRLLDWLEPDEWSAMVEAKAVRRAGEPVVPVVVIRNLGDRLLRFTDLRLSVNGEPVSKWPELTLPPRSVHECSGTVPLRFEGVAELHLDGIAPNSRTSRSLDMAVSRGYPEAAETALVFGFSTYWAFQTPWVPPEFKAFCRAMVERGCQYLRANIPWEDVEPQPGEYDWRVTDGLLAFAAREGLALQFWMFPTARGSGLADAGVPEWTLREPAIDRFGVAGNFPTLWSKFYRKHYFAMVAAFAKRYAKHPALERFVIDFGNSDFPYGYHYYVNDLTLFDYAPQEQQAFANWLERRLDGDMHTASRIFGRDFRGFEDVPVPLAEEADAWKLYLDFRSWSVHQGIKEVRRIIREHAPTKLPPDLPGHGVGSIADTSAYFLEAKAKHWREEYKFPPDATDMHNAGERWGGEPWQVGGDYRQYDEPLFQSVRLNAGYFSIPGADLGSHAGDISLVGYIRRSLAGAIRRTSRVAIMDRTGWHDFRSLANIATRLDIPVDLICARHRYDFSAYRLLVLPPVNHLGETSTGGGGASLMPDDEQWCHLVRESVEKGLNLLIFPDTCKSAMFAAGHHPLREILGLDQVRYGRRRHRELMFPDRFGGGSMVGAARRVDAVGDVLVADATGAPLLVSVRLGEGTVLLAGWDNRRGSPDPAMNPERHCRLPDHTLTRICMHFGVVAEHVRTDRLFVWKEMVRCGGRQYLLMFSHFHKRVKSSMSIKLDSTCHELLDLASGERIPLDAPGQNGWQRLDVELEPRRGRYLQAIQ